MTRLKTFSGGAPKRAPKGGAWNNTAWAALTRLLPLDHQRSSLFGSIFYLWSPKYVSFFLPARKTWIRPLFLDFFENRPNYAISMVHNVFQGHLEVAEHVFDIIFMFHHVFDSV